jgi:uncharacterized membrane protein
VYVISARDARRLRRERGQVVVMFALLLPMFFALAGAVIGIGNWYTHAKHLQTKADAAAFAGGGVWDFPAVRAAGRSTRRSRRRRVPT